MSQTQGTCTTDNSRRAGSIPGLSATRRTGLPCTPVQPLSTFRTSAHPSNIFCTSGEAPASLSPSISTHISTFNNPVDNTHHDGGPEEPKTPMSPLNYAPPDRPLDLPGGSNGDGDEPDPNPNPEPDNPDLRTLPGSPDMLNQFLGGLQQLAHSITANQ
jgi:hypothetical protein